VSRDTLLPRADFSHVFRGVGPGAVDRRSRVLTCVPRAGANPGWRHHTRLQVPSPPAWRWQSPRGVLPSPCRWALIPSSSTGERRTVYAPVSVRLRGGAAPAGLARPAPSVETPARMSQPTVRLREAGPRGPPWRSKTPAHRTVSPRDAGSCRWVSRETSGAPALLSSARRHMSLAKAVGRVRRSSTARAS
jgi:hypothetical protein